MGFIKEEKVYNILLDEFQEFRASPSDALSVPKEKLTINIEEERRRLRIATTASFTMVFPLEMLAISSVNWATRAVESIFGIEGEEKATFEV